MALENCHDLPTLIAPSEKTLHDTLSRYSKSPTVISKNIQSSWYSQITEILSLMSASVAIQTTRVDHDADPWSVENI